MCPVDSIASRVSAASRTIAGNTWWFSASCRLLRVDLERGAPRSSMILPIMMVASSPPRRYHLDLIVAASTPPANGCTAAGQRGEEKQR
eukprot:4825373-Prymnesium_polylepis.1